MLAGLAVLYRYPPDRDHPKWSRASPGALFAAVVWIVGSPLSLYAANFGTYNETYGALGAVVVVILWLLVTALATMPGAEPNCELERQTARNTTTGDERPLGERAGYAADTLGPSADHAATDLAKPGRRLSGRT